MVSSNDLCYLAPRIALLCTLAYGSNNNSFSAEFKISQKNQGTTLKKKKQSSVACLGRDYRSGSGCGQRQSSRFYQSLVPESGLWYVELLVGKESELVCEVGRYGLNIIRLTST